MEASKSSPPQSKSSVVKTFSPPLLKETILQQLELIKNVLNHPRIMKSIPLKTALPPLREILLLLGQTSVEPGDADVLLIGKFLNLWSHKYGDLLPVKSQEDIQVLKNLLNSMKIHSEEKEQAPVFFSNMVEEERDGSPWRVTLLKEERPKGGAPGEEQVYCQLDLFCENLGTVKVVLSGEKEQMFCKFFSGESKSRKIIRKALLRFRENLKSSGLEPPLFTIGRKMKQVKMNSCEISHEKRKGIGLWG